MVDFLWFIQNEMKSKLAESALTCCPMSEKNFCNWKDRFNHGGIEENTD